MSASPVARFLFLLLGASLKGSLIFALVFAATRLMPDSLPRLRHLLWFGAICSCLLILLVSLLGPPLLPIQRTVAPTPDGFYETVSSVLVPQGGLADSSIPGASTRALGKAARGELSWALGGLLLWIAGVLASCLRVAVGSIRLRQLLGEAQRRGAQGLARQRERMLLKLTAAAGIRRRLRILESQACRVPFACGILRPIIMLPSSAPSWPQPRLQAVLLHELRHIGRWDYLTQTIARGICSLFWFACAFLYAEQEKSCDAGVMDVGVAPATMPPASWMQRAFLCGPLRWPDCTRRLGGSGFWRTGFDTFCTQARPRRREC